MSESILRLDGVTGGYTRRSMVLHGVDLSIGRGEALGVTGMNGAGKSTLLRAVAGHLRVASGSVEFLGRDITRTAASARTRAGLVSLPEGHQVLRSLTVRENLRLATGRMTGRGADAALRAHLEGIYELFPILRERDGQLAGLLSGGEQQMLSIGRAIVRTPTLLVLDEPSLGLAPIVVDRIYDAIGALRAGGVSLLVVEQGSQLLRSVCDRIIVLNKGTVTASGAVSELTDEQVHEAYFR
ncbi:ABC transporter ATP-binding protein [Microbacterium sp. No. 7]|uniref:ABC transporter ATP-binding protein n=1 Tax=Microbacterium sp. No. 7 TaxID=1714373 RepID=UPI0006D18405|nr:ABC transporter ATP-binding protein [Microbacterium sp. No. 7]ALJ21863.1 hypothetical protein AOA12_18960 [Microbacterium sp. No. 7]